MKQCQNLYILNILVTLDILQLAKIEESNFTFTTNICTQYREKGLEKRGVYHQKGVSDYSFHEAGIFQRDI